jgi:hypothetical protein
MKLTAYLYLDPVSKCVDLSLHFTVCLQAMHTDHFNLYPYQ